MSLADVVYEEIRSGIVEGRYKPYQRVVEKDLADNLSASRTPVRQALQRLELDGLVVASRHGWTIRAHTAQDIEDLYDIRIALEAEASRLATQRGGIEDLERIDQAREALGQAEASIISGQESDRQDFLKRHNVFHEAIFQATKNALLMDDIIRHRQHPYGRRIAHLYQTDELELIAASHRDLNAAIQGREADRAAEITRAHLAIARDVTIIWLTKSL